MSEKKEIETGKFITNYTFDNVFVKEEINTVNDSLLIRHNFKSTLPENEDKVLLIYEITLEDNVKLSWLVKLKYKLKILKFWRR